MKLPKRGSYNNSIDVLEKDPVIADSFIFSISVGASLETDDPTNHLGRKQTMITDAACLRTESGRMLTGIRTLKSLGPDGTAEQQSENPFLRDGALLVVRVGAPLLGSLAFKRSPDLVGSFYPPDFTFYPSSSEEGDAPVVTLPPDEAFYAAKTFDELFFPTGKDVSMVRIPNEELVEIRFKEAQVFGVGQGLPFEA